MTSIVSVERFSAFSLKIHTAVSAHTLCTRIKHETTNICMMNSLDPTMEMTFAHWIYARPAVT